MQPESAIPTQKELLSLFKEQRSNDENYKASIDRLIELLGGIDAVMDTVLNSSNHKIATKDCVAMKEHLLESSSRSQNEQKLIWTLNTNNNVLHQISPFLHRHIFTKQVIIFQVIMYIVISALDPGVFGLLIPHLYDSKSYQIVWKILMMVYAWTCYIPFFVAALLRINKDMVSRIGQTADAWITIGSATMGMVYIGIWRFLDLEESDSLALDILFFLHSVLATVLFFVFICCMDGLYGIKSKVKMFLLIAMALLNLHGSFMWKYVNPEKVIDIGRLGEYGRLSLNGNIAGSQWVIFLFLSKMALKTQLKGSSRCVLVKNTPYIEWREPTRDVNEDVGANDDKSKDAPKPILDNTEFVSNGVVPQTGNPQTSESVDDVHLQTDEPDLLRVQSLSPSF